MPLQAGPQNEAGKVKPKFNWRHQDVGDANTMGHPLKEAAFMEQSWGSRVTSMMPEVALENEVIQDCWIPDYSITDFTFVVFVYWVMSCFGAFLLGCLLVLPF